MLFEFLHSSLMNILYFSKNTPFVCQLNIALFILSILSILSIQSTMSLFFLFKVYIFNFIFATTIRYDYSTYSVTFFFVFFFCSAVILLLLSYNLPPSYFHQTYSDLVQLVDIILVSRFWTTTCRRCKRKSNWRRRNIIPESRKSRSIRAITLHS
jgi:uncharacterized membrane protein